MDWSSSIEERIRKRLVAKVYVDSVIDYISRRFNVPRNRVSIAFEPIIAGTVKPDLVAVYSGTWFIVEFRTRPDPARDLEHVMRCKHVVDSYVKPRNSIPVLAYVHTAPPSSMVTMAQRFKPLVLLHLIHGTYRVLYESLETLTV